MLYVKQNEKSKKEATKAITLKIKGVKWIKAEYKCVITHNQSKFSLIEPYQKAFGDSTIHINYTQEKLQERILKAKAAIQNKKTFVLVKGDDRFTGFD